MNNTYMPKSENNAGLGRAPASNRTRRRRVERVKANRRSKISILKKKRLRKRDNKAVPTPILKPFENKTSKHENISHEADQAWKEFIQTTKGAQVLDHIEHLNKIKYANKKPVKKCE